MYTHWLYNQKLRCISHDLVQTSIIGMLKNTQKQTGGDFNLTMPPACNSMQPHTLQT